MLVHRRSVFLVGGYDPKTPAAFFDRLGRELGRSAATWAFSSQISPVSVSPGGEIGNVTIDTVGPDWRAETSFNFLVLDSIVLKDFSRPLPVRLTKYLGAFADYVVSGTFVAMLRKAVRFSVYFLYPFMMTVLFAVVSYAVGRAIAYIGIPYPALIGTVVGLGAFWLLLAYLGHRWWVLHLFDLWSFSLNFLRGRRPDAEALLDRFAAAIVAHARQAKPDELILVGHSTGGGLILDIAARCLAVDPGFAAYSGRTAILTLGSTAQKLGMHPAASAFRRRVQALVDDPLLAWVDVQCLIDLINFYKCNPVADMGLEPRVKQQPIEMPFPFTSQVRIRDMLDPQAYKRIKKNIFRIHYQYIFGNNRKYFYDFFMICCGPLPLAEQMLGVTPTPAPAEATP
jgi:pimeloyl-ACP methyl ester carboxylesterase